MMRRIAPFALLAALLLSACGKPAPQPEPVRAVKTLTLTPGAAAGTQAFAGEVRARVESRLGFRVGGKVLRRMVELGQAVKAGQALMEIDPSDYLLGQQAAVAALAAARVNRDQAQADLKRYSELYAQGFIGAAELERRKTTLEAAAASFEQAQAQARQQGNQARYTVLAADADGVITSVDAEPGQVVQAGTPVLRLARNGPRDVVFALPEDQLPLVKPGQRIGVRLWADPTQRLDATVREVAAAADPVTRTYQVKAALQAAPDAVRLGMTATVELPGAGVGVAALKVPLTALFEQQGRSQVWVVDMQKSTVQAQPVQVAAAEGNEVAVLGLQPGQVVVTAGVHVLQPGQKVQPLAAPNVAPAAAASASASPGAR
ncbi:MAG: efflux RND transporter periplasmic adaptor subunit [Betaproteobacteria bacterium]|nr:efflux RND transporter periplasmic adaptor subunit [Betaproteobacteria bacterium]